jgi:hypothetical protein
MLVDFMRDEQTARCGRYHAAPSPQDVQFLADYRRAYTQPRCAVQLGTLRFLDTFSPVPM